MKKILTLVLCLGFLFGCGSENSSKNNTNSPKAKNGDIVKIDYVGKLDGTAFQGGTANGALLELGSGTFIDGFEEQLVDMAVDSSKSIKVTFPANYGSSELAGKETTFDIDLHAIYQPADDAASQNSDIVKIDYVGKLNGTAFQGYGRSGKGQTLSDPYRMVAGWRCLLYRLEGIISATGGGAGAVGFLVGNGG